MQVLFKWDKNYGYFTRRTVYIYNFISLISYDEECFRPEL